MSESKKLRDDQIAAIQERRAGEYGLHEASQNGQREFSDWFWRQLFSAAEDDVSALLSHIAAMEAEYQAGMTRAMADADRVGNAYIEFTNQQTARIEALRRALQMIADGEFFEEENASVARAALEADKANGPG